MVQFSFDFSKVEVLQFINGTLFVFQSEFIFDANTTYVSLNQKRQISITKLSE